MEKKSSKTIPVVITILCIGLVGVLVVSSRRSGRSEALPPSLLNPEVETPVVIPMPKKEMTYRTLTLGTSKHAATIIEAVGQEHLAEVLSLNRVDVGHLQNNEVIVIPDSFDDPFALSSFPKEIPELRDVPKMMFIAQKEQEFGAYENGVLVRFGGISTGKKSTPTTNKLFYANWKGKEVISTSNDEWILKWNVNIANRDGIGIHEYELPGYPASHSCIRLSAQDAQWFYGWVENWILSPDEKLLAQGTPVLVFGEYGFGKTAPWKLLPEDPKATTITLDSLQEKIGPLLEDIHAKQEQRVAVVASYEDGE